MLSCLGALPHKTLGGAKIRLFTEFKTLKTVVYSLKQHVCGSSLLQGLHSRSLLRHHQESSVLSGRRDSGSGQREAPVQWRPTGSARKPHTGGRHLGRRSGNTSVSSWSVFSVSCCKCVVNEITLCVQRKQCFVPATRPCSPRWESTLTCSLVNRLSSTHWWGTRWLIDLLVERAVDRLYSKCSQQNMFWFSCLVDHPYEN